MAIDLHSEYATLTPEQLAATTAIKQVGSELTAAAQKARHDLGGHPEMFAAGDQRLAEAVMWYVKAIT